MNEDLKKRIEALEAWKAQLENATDIPLEIDQSFRARFSDISSNNISIGGKSASSENIGVNEAGASTYSVLAPPDNFAQITINGTTYYIPVFT